MCAATCMDSIFSADYFAVSTGNELVWQRERARNFGFRSAERFEYIEATFKPFKFLVNSEEGVHSLCAERARRRRFYEGYKANEPMRLPMRAGYADPQGTHAVAAAVDMSSGTDGGAAFQYAGRPPTIGQRDLCARPRGTRRYTDPTYLGGYLAACGPAH
ncbi:unnamed protein product [Parascedosporium putredinis]|uniref:Uncharacterized protein n=1 Tax=Parascedosporium putredinis TaxID=1442378 RepID=A0A9P1GZL4_9PEZI|nr:unnamed protein product [Parascedosporium putredinis]CAI7990916.1 unnamed protein product [Parascedosporium putredinis]